MRSTKEGRRRYRLGKRADAAARTRRRIVEATLAAHDELGIPHTSLRDIAARAGVAPSTILHHFPEKDELIRACGELSDALAPMPTAAVFDGIEDEVERIARLAAALFGWWERMGPGFDRLRTDRLAVPLVDEWFRTYPDEHRRLAAAAMPGAPAERVAQLVALTTPDAWHALQRSDMDVEAAARSVAELIGHASVASSRKGVH